MKKNTLIYKNWKVTHRTLLVLAIFIISGCKKLVNVPPPTTGLASGSVYENDQAAISAVTGIYTRIMNSPNFVSGQGVTFFCGLSADEFTLWNGITNNAEIAYYTNNLAVNIAGSELWNALYPYIFQCNDAITYLNNSTSLTPAIRVQLLGEAKFMRALFYFYLTNLYGPLPLVLTTNYTSNALLSREPQTTIYQQIISDLHDAENLLSPQYLDGTLLVTSNDRVRPTKWAAMALLARAYLYSDDWGNAENLADSVINNSTLFKLSSLKNAFLRASLGNLEAIWQMQPVTTGQTNTQDAPLYIITSTGPSIAQPVYLSNSLLQSFEPNDGRRLVWVDSVVISGKVFYYPYKYKINTLNSPVTEHQMILRLAELFLIRAEARAQQGDISGAQTDLNVIRSRAGLPNTTANSQTDLLSAIMRERRIEFFAELGNRWLDLKRTNSVDSVMSPACIVKGGNWNTYQKLYPIGDVPTDPNLVQNSGY